MANDNPDGLELHLRMLHDLMQNKAEVNSVYWRNNLHSLFWRFILANEE